MYISEFMIKTPPQSSNSVSCREKYSEALRLLILKGLFRSGRIVQLHAGLFFALDEVEV